MIGLLVLGAVVVPVLGSLLVSGRADAFTIGGAANPESTGVWTDLPATWLGHQYGPSMACNVGIYTESASDTTSTWRAEYACQGAIPDPTHSGSPTIGSFQVGVPIQSCVDGSIPCGVSNLTEPMWGLFPGSAGGGSCDAVPDTYGGFPLMELRKSAWNAHGFGGFATLTCSSSISLPNPDDVLTMQWESIGYGGTWEPDTSTGKAWIAVQLRFGITVLGGLGSGYNFGLGAGPAAVPCEDSACVSSANGNLQGFPSVSFAAVTGYGTNNASIGAAVDSVSFFPFTSPGVPSLPDVYFIGGTGQEQAPCVLYSVTGPVRSSYDAGAAYGYTFVFGQDVAEIIVDPNDTSGSTSGPHGTGSDSTLDQVGDNAGQQTVVARPTATGAWIPEFYCVSKEGVVYPWGSANGIGSGIPPGGGGGGQAFDLSQCFAQAGNGLSLWDPVSWIVAGAKVGLCGLEWLFIPPPGVVSGLEAQFGIGVSPSDALPATEWLGAGTRLISSWPSSTVTAIKTAADGSSCDTGGFTVGGHSLSLCSALEDTAANASVSARWGAIDDILTAVFLIMFGLSMFFVFRRLLADG